MQADWLQSALFVFLVLTMCGASATLGVYWIGRLFPWLVSRRDDTAGGTILWWELRRIPYNFLIGFYGVLCLLVFLCGIVGSGELKPGEDAVEPMGLFLAPCFVNVCYRLGWLVELVLRLILGPSPHVGPFLFRLGLGFSFFVISIPAVVWAAHAMHILR